MATHKVQFTIPQRELGKADVAFDVKRDGEKFGCLKVSNGSAVWFPKNKKQGLKMSWVQLDEIFQKIGVKTEKR